MQNSLKTKNQLRVKHIAQLEEKKANLEGLKTKMTQQFFPINSGDILNFKNNNQFDDSKSLPI
jgi:hypothetical protein